MYMMNLLRYGICRRRIRRRFEIISSSSYYTSDIFIRSLSSSSTSSSNNHNLNRRCGSIGVALSGGVDSSVAAYLLVLLENEKNDYPQQQSTTTTGIVTQNNNNVIGIHMSNWDYHEEDNSIDKNIPECYEQDWKDAQDVAKHLHIPIYHTSFASDYWTYVFEPYCDQLSSGRGTVQQQQQQQQQQFVGKNNIGKGRTINSSSFSSSMWMPNPDVDCNRHIKFGVLKEYVHQRLGLEYLATGHYARLWDPTMSSGSSSSSILKTMPECLQKTLDDDPLLYDMFLDSETPTLLAANDLSKDQSYFLSSVSGNAFRNVLFPLGDLQKKYQENMILSSITANNNNNNDKQQQQQQQQQKETIGILNERYDNIIRNRTVREIAQYGQLPTALKRESMGICFVGKRQTFGEFVHQYIPPPPPLPTLSLSEEVEDKDKHDLIVNESSSSSSNLNNNTYGNFINIEDGTIVGKFDPYTTPQIVYSTIGQGAKISGAKQKWFIADKTNCNTTIYVCQGTHHPSLYTNRFFISYNDMNFITKVPNIKQQQHQSKQFINMLSSSSMEDNNNNNNNSSTIVWSVSSKCRIRHLQPLVDCEIILRHDTNTNNLYYYEIILSKPLRGICPGQAAVFYVGQNGLICIGGGAINQRGPSYFDLGLDLPNQLHPSGHNDLSVLRGKSE